ncbi:MAG: hypothetical protein IPG10_08860 [Flavobacteriales bacterium]|nr:hypothetical protein [Flavobacteriales bacterium]
MNGFLASSTEEWVAKVSRLIEDAELRGRIDRRPPLGRGPLVSTRLARPALTLFS